ncbi:MAG TPA: hypothetical protein VFZ65_17770 [Planctomycetota bacterium]|nr:hypothetical protein [Planctomycetota bacterium]
MRDIGASRELGATAQAQFDIDAIAVRAHLAGDQPDQPARR